MRRIGVAAALAASMFAGQAVGQGPARPDPNVPMTERTEKIGLVGRKGESLFRPGFGVGEYTGVSSARIKQVRGAGVFSSDAMKASFSVSSPTLPAPIKGDCQGKQGEVGFIITFDREDLHYDCAYTRGDAPAPDLNFALAFSKGSFLQRLGGLPQRAAQLRWDKQTYMAQTKKVGSGLPISMGGVFGYVITHDGVEVGGVDLAGLRPTFYLPPKGSPDRDPVAVMALTLFFFQDPARRAEPGF